MTETICPFPLTVRGMVAVVATCAGHVLTVLFGGTGLICHFDGCSDWPPGPAFTTIIAGSVILMVASWAFWGGRAILTHRREQRGVEAHQAMRAAFQARDAARQHGLPWPDDDGLPRVYIERGRNG